MHGVNVQKNGIENMNHRVNLLVSINKLILKKFKCKSIVPPKLDIDLDPLENVREIKYFVILRRLITVVCKHKAFNRANNRRQSAVNVKSAPNQGRILLLFEAIPKVI